jgi:hypothetical protein
MVDKTLKANLKRLVMKYSKITFSELQTSVAELRVVSKQTIQHTLQDHLKMPWCVAAMKPLLTDKMKSKRLRFAQSYQHFTTEDWSKVMYADNLTAKCIRASRAEMRTPTGATTSTTYRKSNTRRAPSNIQTV